MLLSKDEQKAHRGVIATHADTLKSKKRAAKSALRLARDAVARQKSATLRSEFYSLAIRLNARLDELDLHQNVLARAEADQEKEKEI
ncbi:hypothetical protein [Candidimonas sp. SYP-B2681]|uniref:hypothetical protein n=1 Tax=Candidimonas sp. SYP-B2681 TaxID=2497686 RepID=UPI0013157F10|nr:hypothetical protein [Candidimonas sp. SYP-B2681]